LDISLKMLYIQLHKMDKTGVHCSNTNCKKNFRDTINILGSVYYIRVDTTVAIISLGGKEEYYCRGCIDEIYDMIRAKLDPKLWAFH
jgi:hypothetical protein